MNYTLRSARNHVFKGKNERGIRKNYSGSLLEMNEFCLQKLWKSLRTSVQGILPTLEENCARVILKLYWAWKNTVIAGIAALTV
jgi:hypothetical protein